YLSGGMGGRRRPERARSLGEGHRRRDADRFGSLGVRWIAEARPRAGVAPVAGDRGAALGVVPDGSLRPGSAHVFRLPPAAAGQPGPAAVGMHVSSTWRRLVLARRLALDTTVCMTRPQRAGRAGKPKPSRISAMTPFCASAAMASSTCVLTNVRSASVTPPTPIQGSLIAGASST